MVFRRIAPILLGLGLSILAACTHPQPAAQAPSGDAPITPAQWPAAAPGIAADPMIEARVAALLGAMSLEQKISQLVQGDIGALQPGDITQYRLGSVLAGGNSAPGGKAYATGPEWLAYADAIYEASKAAPGGGPWIPIVFGIDAVHGHNNVIGATLFPHNIGLGAARNPELIKRIASATAAEVAVTGIDWTFAPTLAVAANDRWGRTYESYSEDPALVASYAGAVVEGLQGPAGTPFGAGRVIATAKHFVGDGATTDGKDQGDAAVDEAELRNVHAAGYPPAINAGAQTLMASFSSWRGRKLHGSSELLTGVVKQRWAFDGFVVGDWNGHAQLPGCTATDCPEALMAGLDMYMAPDSWKGLRESLLAQAKSGEIPLARVNEAVGRILRVKLRAGLFEAEKPSKRPLAGRFELLGAPAHRAIAREAVRQSLVLLKNERALLPLARASRVLVAGDGANTLAKQSGGWTLTWQGAGLGNELFPGATSILSGIQAAVEPAGGVVQHSPDGAFTQKPDVAIVVFGEDPYAEFQGDLPNVDFADERPLALLRRLRAQGVPVVSVFLSGRPLWVNPELNASDAFVAAWLPGSEGAGVADVLFRDAKGTVAHDFRGRLPFSWPKTPRQSVLNLGQPEYDPLFPLSYGLSYAAAASTPQFSEEVGDLASANDLSSIVLRGRPAGAWRLETADAQGASSSATAAGSAPGGGVTSLGFDRFAQEDALRAIWRGDGSASFGFVATMPLDVRREANGGLELVLETRTAQAPPGAELSLECGPGCGGKIAVAAVFAERREWGTVRVPLRCFSEAGGDLKQFSAIQLRTAAPWRLEFYRIGIEQSAGAPAQCPPAR